MAQARSRIATLLAADVAEYSRLLASDDPHDEQVLEERRNLFLQLIDEHGGRCHTTAGKSLVAEFPNAVNAVRCAVAIQQGFLKENEPLPPEERVLLRIGLHIGEVTEDTGSLHGDGVEIAIRLESLAVPGGICLTRAVYEQIKHKLHIGVEFTGEREIKNIPEPVAIYQVVEPGVDKGYFSLWSELKRRNVVRVGVAYAVVSWLLIQVASIVFPAFDAPRWIMQASIALVILGFPVALVLAWVYEITPMGLKRSDQVLRQASIRKLTGRRFDRAIISLLVVVVAFLIFDNYVPMEVAETSELESVAVLAFRNLSPDPDDQYFADGLADELLSVLSRVPELKVASRMASFYYEGKDVDIATIAKTLEVDNVLSGSVRREGRRIRVVATLDDPATGDLLWSEIYERSLDDILEIQSDIARKVVDAIVPVLSPESLVQIEARPTENTEAYDYYLRGRDYLRQPVEERALASAVELFNRAIELDARFAHAFAGLCEAQLGNFELTRNTAFFERAEVACHRALTLNGSLWDTHVALGNLYRINGQYDRAISELETAIEQQPNAVSPYLALALAYEGKGELDQAEATFLRAEEVESSYWDLHRDFGNFLYRAYRFDEAIERYTKVTELAPDSDIGYNNLGNLYLSLGALDEAEQAFTAAPQQTRWTYANRGLVYYYRGEFAKAAEDQKQALAIAPEYFANWGRLADAYRFIEGEGENARHAYETAIDLARRELLINPTNWEGLGRLATYYAHTERPDEALDLIDRMLMLSSDGEAYYYATLVSAQLGNLDRVHEYLEKTIEGGWPAELLANDPDLAALRGDERIDELLSTP